MPINKLSQTYCLMKKKALSIARRPRIDEIEMQIARSVYCWDLCLDGLTPFECLKYPSVMSLHKFLNIQKIKNAWKCIGSMCIATYPLEITKHWQGPTFMFQMNKEFARALNQILPDHGEIQLRVKDLKFKQGYELYSQFVVLINLKDVINDEKDDKCYTKVIKLSDSDGPTVKIYPDSSFECELSILWYEVEVRIKNVSSEMPDTQQAMYYETSSMDTAIVDRDDGELKCHRDILLGYSKSLAEIAIPTSTGIDKIYLTENSGKCVELLLCHIYGKELVAYSADVIVELFQVAYEYDFQLLKNELKEILLQNDISLFKPGQVVTIFNSIFKRDTNYQEVKDCLLEPLVKMNLDEIVLLEEYNKLRYLEKLDLLCEVRMLQHSAERKSKEESADKRD